MRFRLRVAPQLDQRLPQGVAVRRGGVHAHGLGVLCARLLIFFVGKIEVSQLYAQVVAIGVDLDPGKVGLDGVFPVVQSEIGHGQKLRRIGRKSRPAPQAHRPLEVADRPLVVLLHVRVDPALQGGMSQTFNRLKPFCGSRKEALREEGAIGFEFHLSTGELLFSFLERFVASAPDS